MLVLTDIYYPGWVARVNSRPAAISATHVAFRGVAVDAGRSTVEFQYRPANFRRGLLLASAAVVTVTGVVVAQPFLRRRRLAAVDQDEAAGGQTE